MDIKFMRSIALDFNQGKEYFNVFLQSWRQLNSKRIGCLKNLRDFHNLE